ncbi:hypothetical protein BC936DRAFT_144361 [Jimgerdemannia flammicorona]|uniref:Uncharacterized protein n=1 Tax=Jimgerdemannia flammicorona TaxID=994334 RepID=A0A433DM94_9FUNG|nr:hypothetical protein BC936DRAFT_144361 [Jimgerdemannia flammicorona]
MATKSIDDHRSAINALLNNLAEIERLGNEFFFKAVLTPDNRPLGPILREQGNLIVHPVPIAGRAK